MCVSEKRERERAVQSMSEREREGGGRKQANTAHKHSYCYRDDPVGERNEISKTQVLANAQTRRCI